MISNNKTKEHCTKLHLLKSKKNVVYSYLIFIYDFNDEDNKEEHHEEQMKMTKMGHELDSLGAGRRNWCVGGEDSIDVDWVEIW